MLAYVGSRTLYTALSFIHLLVALEIGISGNPDAKRLYDDLLSNYNSLVRPVINSTDKLSVTLKLKLSQLIDVVSFISHLSKHFLKINFEKMSFFTINS